MDYSNRTLRQEYLQKLQDLYDQRVTNNELTDYIKMVLIIQSTSELLDHPELFETAEEYEIFRETNPVSDEVRYIYSTAILPSIRQTFYTTINSQLTTQLNNDRRNDYNFTQEYIIRESKEELANKQAEQLEAYIINRAKKYTNKINTDYNIKTLTEKLQNDADRVNLIIRQQELQKDNMIRYTMETLQPEELQSKYKTWVWNPNPHTRHTQMANTTVPLNEDFLVISDQKSCPDQYLRYPLDPRGSDCQCLNCMCTLAFHDRRQV